MPEKKTAILTGATGRLGRLVAHELDSRGYSVVALVRSVDDALNAGFSAYPCDLTDEESVVTVFEHVRSVHARIDAVIHTVGMWAAAPLLDTRLSDWRAVMDVNLTSTFLCLREGARALQAGGGGGLVAIASRQGADQAPAEQAAYAASKAGVIRLVEAAAAELAGSGVTARVVAPSMILFDGMTGAGVKAVDLARVCVDLADPTYPMVSGSLLRAYGDTA